MRFERDRITKFKRNRASGWGGNYVIPKSTFFSRKSYQALL